LKPRDDPPAQGAGDRVSHVGLVLLAAESHLARVLLVLLPVLVMLGFALASIWTSSHGLR
jgi:hypothetical protein